MSDEPISAISFDTDRLSVGPRSMFSASAMADLPTAVSEMLNSSPDDWLPPGWAGDFDTDRATRWISEIEAEAELLVAMDRDSSQVAGVLILFIDLNANTPDRMVRIGYLISPRLRGKGIATELVRGLVNWCRDSGDRYSITAGTHPGNIASARVLEKCGFSETSSTGNETIYSIDL